MHRCTVAGLEVEIVVAANHAPRSRTPDANVDHHTGGAAVWRFGSCGIEHLHGLRAELHVGKDSATAEQHTARGDPAQDEQDAARAGFLGRPPSLKSLFAFVLIVVSPAASPRPCGPFICNFVFIVFILTSPAWAFFIVLIINTTRHGMLPKHDGERLAKYHKRNRFACHSPESALRTPPTPATTPVRLSGFRDCIPRSHTTFCFLLMLLLSCTNLSRGYGATPLFEEVSFEIHAGERVGFVGPNGAGKTTLIRILAGLDEADSGKVQYHAGARVGLLQQVAEFPAGRTLFEEAKSAFDELLAKQREFERIAEELAVATDEAEHKQLADKFDRLSEVLRHHDAFELDHKVEGVLGGLGFLDADFHRDLATFSGGQQRRLLLAKLLLSAPDVMLLDEPSNHLDIDTTRWLENYLAQQPEGMLVVSHDRYFLDKVTNKTFELHQRKITTYPGNYKQYVRLRDERYERLIKEYEAQKEYVEKQEEYIRRAHYGQLAKQAQSRVKTLDKIERLEKPTRVSGPNIAFQEVSRSGDVCFHTEDLTKRYGEKVLFENLSFDVKRGKRLGIMGPNGSGKTTLLRILLGEEEPTSGLSQRGHLVFPGYLDQHLGQLDPEKSVVRAVWPDDDATQTEQKMRDLLGSFGLQGETVEQPVKSLSGGEKSRAALAKLTVNGANLLILDEPTNHLDIWACDSLEEALKAFGGTCIVVSHDRYFLNRVVDLLIVLDGQGGSEVVYGNYDTFELLRQARLNAEASGQASGRRQSAVSGSNSGLTPAARPEPVKRKRKFPYRTVADLEAEIAATETKVATLEAALQNAEIYKDPPRLKQTMADLDATKDALARLYQHWEEAVELNK